MPVTLITIQRARNGNERDKDVLPFTQARWNEQLLRTVLALNLSFRSVENPEFLRLERMLNPTLIVPRRARLRQLLQGRHAAVSSALVAMLQSSSKVSLAVDTWTSPNHLAFLSITAYVIDSDWQYREALIGFEHISGSHTGDNLASIVFNVLKNCQIDDRLFAITADNASNNNTMRQSLSRLLRIRSRVAWDSTAGTVPCLAHVVQLVVGEIVNSLHIQANEETTKTWTDTWLREIKDDLKFGTLLKKVGHARQ